MTIVDELDRRLAPIGWARAEPWDDAEYVTYARRPNDEISFELGLDVEPRDWGGLSLLPRVGVRHAEVARLTAHILGQPSGSWMTGAALLDLVPDAAGTRWMTDFADGVRGEQAAADQVAADLRAYGDPYLAGRATLADVIARLATDSSRNQLDDMHLAVAHMLSGDKSAARQALAAFETKAVDKPVLARSLSDTFLDGFRDHFNLA
jgi:hypothetical protein